MQFERGIAICCTASMFVLVAGTAIAASYPDKPIRIFASEAGATTDFIARLIAQGISGPLGQPVIVENRPSDMATEMAARAAPDGYTMHLTGGGSWILPLLQKTPYDPVKDFTPITLVAVAPLVLVVSPVLQIKSVRELIDLAKAKPGVLNWGSPPIGGVGHLAGELFKVMAGVNFVRVPYKGSTAATAAVVAGEVQLQFSTTESAAPHLQTGRLTALGVTGTKRYPPLPDLPPIAATVPGYEAVSPTGLWAPAGMPGAAINRIYEEVLRVVSRPDIKEKLLSSGNEAVGSSPAEFSAFIKADMARWSRVIKEENLRLQ